MVSRAHDVSEAEKPGYLVLCWLFGGGDEAAVGVWNTHELTLCAIREAANAVVRSPPAAVQA